jgi:hypothetical protein
MKQSFEKLNLKVLLLLPSYDNLIIENDLTVFLFSVVQTAKKCKRYGRGDQNFFLRAKFH